MAKKKVVEYFIYKKTQGARYPGECWDGPFTWAKAHHKWLSNYCDLDLKGKLAKKQTFRIVKVTTEAV